jgi:hypothetical protein
MVGYEEPPSTGKSKLQELNSKQSIVESFCEEGQYHFITLQSSEDRKARRQARSHAVARGLEKKRKAQLKMGQNFRTVAPKSKVERHISPDSTLVKQPCIPLPASPCFFSCLAAESPRLHELLYQGKFISDRSIFIVRIYRHYRKD